MKRLIYLICLIFLLSDSVRLSAQFVIGIKAGGNYSSCYTTYISAPLALTYGFVPGWHGGAILSYFISENLSVRSETLIGSTGTRMQFQYGEQPAATLRSTYLSVPVLVKFRPVGQFFFTGGGAAAWRISKDVLNFTGYNRLDFMIAAGLGYDFSRKTGIELRYNHGAMRIGNTPILYNHQPSGGIATMSQCFQLAFEYRFATIE